MQRNRRIMVALARTAADAGLIRYAAMVARLGTAEEVRFVHVAPAVGEQDRLRAALQSDVQSHFTDVSNAVSVSFGVLTDPLMDSLLTHVVERQTDLLLLGHRRDHPGRQALARRMAMKAPCSIWMVPDGSPATIRRILVPVDFSEHSADTMRVAVSLARLGGAECRTLHVYFNEAVVSYEGYDDIIRGEEKTAYEKFIAGIDVQGVTITPHFEESAHVAHAIERVAERDGIDLIVMGTRGRSRSAAILLGSVTEEMIIETRVPLLAVKHYGAQVGLLEALLNRTFHPGSSIHT